ncbi:hypothetical protein LLE49_24330 [Alicyclobacillus tolerans]|uniref:beta strand repeat-containing protein n=1 Tax=Alicyclobacillus tolerans TaxID=90970 RepID=UPI001F38E7B1|nr:hypothetical protein [Alicyclobacillus tolerans]MCF8567853.1 hypothetical protein [Alicyclobacillus tolerans]
MKRTLTSIAAATLALGTMAAPVAFAGTSSMTWNKYSIGASSYKANPEGFAAMQSGTMTTFMPIYYVMQALKGMGYTVTWTGNALSIVTPSGVTPDFSNLQLGTGNVTIFVNGTPVKMVDTMVEGDPASGGKIKTSYMPIFYINQILQDAGVTPGWNGSGWTMTPATPATTQPTVSAITISGESLGTGSASSPAVSTGSPVTVSAKLTDAMGNPVVGVNLVLQLTQGSTAPTVTVNGATVAQNSGGSGFNFNVPTDSTGTATAQISVASGSTVSYKVKFNAPYTQNGVTVSSPSSYVQFVPNGNMALAPEGSSAAATSSAPSNVYNTSISGSSNQTTGLVPVVVTIPPINGVAQSNVQVQFTLNTWNGSNWTTSKPAGAFFANAQGLSISTSNTYTTYTNAQGQATVYVNDFSAETVQVKAQAQNDSYLSNSTAYSYVGWGQAGVASQTANVSASNVTAINAGTNNYNASVGTNVTITGQAQDAAGNAVPNASLLVTQPSGNGSYVSGTTSTGFPSTSSSLAVGTPVSSSYGEVVTADGSGNFTFTVTDSTPSNTDTYYIYPVNNGSVAGSSIGNATVTWQPGSTLTQIALAAGNTGSLGSYFSGTFNSNNPVPVSLTGVQAVANGSSPASVVFGGFNGYTELQGSNLNQTYNLSANNGATISSVDIQTASGYEAIPVNPTTSGTTFTGTTLSSLVSQSIAASNGVSALSIPVSGSGSTYTITVNGTQYTATSPEIQVDMTDTSVESDTLTIQSGSVKETVPVTFTANTPDRVGAFTPVSSTLNKGGTETITFTVEDDRGNPIGNQEVSLGTDGTAQGLWITQVNGVALAQTEATSGTSTATEPTPIPLGQGDITTTKGITGYGQVNIPGVVVWNNPGTITASNPDTINVWSNSNGQVTLTVASSPVTYYSGTTAPYTAASTPSASSTSASVYTTGNPLKTQNTSSYQVYIGNTSPFTPSKSVGSITW